MGSILVHNKLWVLRESQLLTNEIQPLLQGTKTQLLSGIQPYGTVDTLLQDVVGGTRNHQRNPTTGYKTMHAKSGTQLCGNTATRHGGHKRTLVGNTGHLWTWGAQKE